MIVYDRLWKTMEDRHITKSALVRRFGLSPSLITRLKRNQSISVHTINTLCTILKCNVEDIMEYIEDDLE
ncbi:MAG: helix-turn-helix transcriptional regulator [Lachnospiraceae bacterium]|nr:helix-turn-helix transcriptional regulator [Lachnospiraceae bacterium]